MLVDGSTDQRQRSKQRHTSTSPQHSHSLLLTSQGLSSCHWTYSMQSKGKGRARLWHFFCTICAKEATHTSTSPEHSDSLLLTSQGLSSYHWTAAMASEATHFYFTPTFTLTLFDVTGSQLVPLDRLNGQRGDTLLLHPNICTHSL